MRSLILDMYITDTIKEDVYIYDLKEDMPLNDYLIRLCKFVSLLSEHGIYIHYTFG
jgi:hypothetical protein